MDIDDLIRMGLMSGSNVEDDCESKDSNIEKTDSEDELYVEDNSEDMFGMSIDDEALDDTMSIYDDPDDMLDSDELTAEGFHNKAMNHAKRGEKKAAFMVCEEGLRRFPNSIDLVADAIKFASDIGEDKAADKYHKLLVERFPKNQWKWRQFTYLIDYLIEKSGDDNEIKSIISDYHTFMPTEEKAGVAESEYYEKIGNHSKAKEALEKYIEKSFHAPQCAAKLITIYMEEGEFEKAKKISQYYEIASNEIQPSANYSIHLYENALIENALLRKKEYLGEEVTVDEYIVIKNMFEQLLKVPQIVMLFSSDIKEKITGLDMVIKKMGEE